jgi:hypothetical protein
MRAGGGRVGGCTAAAQGTYHWAPDWAWAAKDSEETGSESWPGEPLSPNRHALRGTAHPCH